MEAAIVFKALFGIVFVIGAAPGIVALTRLREVDQNDFVRIPELLRRSAIARSASSRRSCTTSTAGKRSSGGRRRPGSSA